jgi:catechol 2,3-dioxygenase-like lactoylglutathione lyase family enzyme
MVDQMVNVIFPGEIPMKFELSNCVALETKNPEKAVEFYQTVLGLQRSKQTAEFTEFKSGPFNFYVAKENHCPGVMLDFRVADLEAAVEHLQAHGCQVLQWDGKGSDCFMKDPFGLVFNLSQSRS